MPSNACYYLYLSFIAISIAVYNFTIASEGRSIECFKQQQMSDLEFKVYYDSINQRLNTTDDEYNALMNLKLKYPIDNFNDTGKDSNFTVAVHQTNQYQSLIQLVAIFYITIFTLSLILTLLTLKMANMVPDDFVNISRFSRIAACFCKVFPMALVILHYVVLVLVVVIWGFHLTKSCYLSASPLPGVYKHPTYYYQQVLIVNIVTSVFWVIIHCGGAVIRDSTYQEPYMYSPMVGKDGKCSYILLKKLGP